jgi:hypothetical protein
MAGASTSLFQMLFSPEVGLMPILRTMPAAKHPRTKSLIGLAGRHFRSIQLAAKGAAECVSSAGKFRNDNRNMHLQIASIPHSPDYS